MDLPELRVVVDNPLDGETEQEERSYPPPKKPLSPQQLGRIAQSFGIAMPSLPLPSPTLSMSPSSPSSSRFPSNHALPTRHTHSSFLLAVIPPINLLDYDPSSRPSADKIRKWRRGRLLTLQPTIGGMLLAISRDFGLPSTLGISLYLVQSTGQGGIPTSDEPTGPLISPQIWSTLFATHIHQSNSTSRPISRSSTPSHTPSKGSGVLGKEQYPPSPLSMVEELDRKRSLSTEPPLPSHSHSVTSSSSSSGLPLTPASATTAIPPIANNPVVGTIEFEIDPELAPWLDGARRKSLNVGVESRHRRKISTLSEGGNESVLSSSTSGMKELRLPKKMKDGRMRFLKEMDPNVDDEMDDIFGGSFRSANTSLSRDESDRSLGDDMSGRLFESLRPPREKRLSLRSGHGGMGAMSQSASFDELQVDEGGETSLGAEGEEVDVVKEMDDMVSMLENAGLEEEKRGELIGRVIQVRDEVDKRGSGIVMAEQLDDLERSESHQVSGCYR
jgi:hypothetical protein